MRHPDEQILQERAAFRGMLAHELQILRDAFERIDLEPARNPAQHGGPFVMRKIVARLRAQMRQHLADRGLVRSLPRFLRDRLAAGRVLILDVGLVRIGKLRRQPHPRFVRHELHQLRRHLRHRQHPIHHARC